MGFSLFLMFNFFLCFFYRLEGIYELLKFIGVDGNWLERWDILIKNNLYWNKIVEGEKNSIICFCDVVYLI